MSQPTNSNGQYVRRVTLPSGRSIEVVYFEPLADRLRDDEPRGLRQAALRARAAFGPKDSVRDVVPGDVSQPLLDAIDRLLKQLNRRDAG